jgi:xanthine dehydrogenase accessory factor
VLAELRSDGVSERHLAQIDVPAGLDLGGRTPAEIALSILAQIVAVRRGGEILAGDGAAHSGEPAADAAPAALAVDPICGMTVAVLPSTPSVTLRGQTAYFCCERCKSTFEAQHEHAGA